MKTKRSRNLDNDQRRPPSVADLDRFRAIVWLHYKRYGRTLPWRETEDPYLIMVSEFMLQQTQVARVTDKYRSFARRFPTLESLASAPVADVLRAWQGLGYNRRALNLRDSARLILWERKGVFPRSYDELLTLPGVGPSTAAAICAFAYAIPMPFIETNIRSAFIHHFFGECSRVSDAELLPLVEATLDARNPREWYWALMDYGSWLKKNVPNPSRRSAHNAVQSPFTGSHRQLRAEMLRVFLAQESPMAADPQTCTQAHLDPESVRALLPGWGKAEIEDTLEELAREGFLCSSVNGYALA